MRVLSSYSLKSFMKQFVHLLQFPLAIRLNILSNTIATLQPHESVCAFFLALVILNGNAVFLMCILLMMIFAVLVEPCRR